MGTMWKFCLISLVLYGFSVCHGQRKPGPKITKKQLQKDLNILTQRFESFEAEKENMEKRLGALELELVYDRKNNEMLTKLLNDTIEGLDGSRGCTCSPGQKKETGEPVPGEPKRVRVNVVNSTTLYVEWRQVEASEQHGVIRGYYVFYVKLNNEGEPEPQTDKTIDVDDPNTNEVVIVGLDPDTRYSVAVAAYTRKGDGIRSKPKVVTTKGAVPSAPRNLSVEFQQEDPPIINVSWQKPEESHGDIVNYKLYYGHKGLLYLQEILPAGRMGFITPILHRGILYEFIVMAKNEINYGARAIAEIETPLGEPPTPVNVTVVRTSPSRILVTWDQPTGDHIIAKYRIYYCSFMLPDMSMWNTKDTEGPTTVAEITGIEHHTSYVVRVRAMSVSNLWSNYSDVVSSDFMPSDRSDTVQNFQTSGRSSHQLTLSWDKPRRKSVVRYRLEYQGVKTRYIKGCPERDWTKVMVKTIPAAQTRVVLRDLTPRTRYFFNITASFEDGVTGEKVMNIAETRIEDI